MSRRRPRLRILTLAALALLAGLGLSANWWVDHHLEVVGRGHLTRALLCTRCHLGGGGQRFYDHGPRFPGPVALALGPLEERLYVSCEGTDEVVEIDTRQGRILRRLSTGAKPHGLALDRDGEALFVALRGEDRVAVLELETGAEQDSIPVGSAPCGLALSPDGRSLVVANSASDDISLIDAPRRVETVRLAAGREPIAVTIRPDGRLAYVANRLARVHAPPDAPEAELTVVQLEQRRIERRLPLQSAHLSEGVAASAQAGLALVSLSRVRNLLPITQVARGWVMTSGLGFLRPSDGSLRQFPLDEVNRFFADPSAVVLDERSRRAYVASGGGNTVSVVDLARLEQLAQEDDQPSPGRFADHLGISSEYVLARLETGPNPRALLLSADGARLFVAERLGDAVAVFDTSSYELIERISLGGPGVLSAQRRGEIVFHDASITFQGQFSCRSCHPDGHVDGLTYDFAIDGLGRNILDNRSLQGLDGTAPFKWNGQNETLHDQCGPRFAKVLTMADPIPEADLDDLVAFIRSLPPPPGLRGPDGRLTEAQRRGRQIFERQVGADGAEIPAGSRCVTCHAPPLYTNRLPTRVASLAPTDTVEEFDTPHLLGIGASAPYLHDGRARTLEEIWTVYGKNNSHGQTDDLSKTQLNDLVQFLRSL